MRVLVCPDSYKGFLRADEAAQAIAQAFGRIPGVEIDMCPMADGGEGSLALWAAAKNARVVEIPACNPFHEPVLCQAAFSPDSHDVLLEAAQTCGLFPAKRQNPGRMLSTGLGLAMRRVLDMNPQARIQVALGGTGTVDGGLGAAMALGLRASVHGREIRPQGPLELPPDAVLSFSSPFAHPPVFWCDTRAPLLGPGGAVALFGRQKGVTGAQAPAFERALQNLAQAAARAADPDAVFEDAPGLGAAGGMALVFVLLCGAQIKPGAAAFMELTGFCGRAAQADVVVTGEGRLDATSFSGKLVGEIAAACRTLRKPLWVFPGQNALPEPDLPPGMQVFPVSSFVPADAAQAWQGLFQTVARALEKIQKNGFHSSNFSV